MPKNPTLEQIQEARRLTIDAFSHRLILGGDRQNPPIKQRRQWEIDLSNVERIFDFAEASLKRATLER